jgi:hypothetical protein
VVTQCTWGQVASDWPGSDSWLEFKLLPHRTVYGNLEAAGQYVFCTHSDRILVTVLPPEAITLQEAEPIRMLPVEVSCLLACGPLGPAPCICFSQSRLLSWFSHSLSGI